jgi:hypothetical protein
MRSISWQHRGLVPAPGIQSHDPGGGGTMRTGICIMLLALSACTAQKPAAPEPEKLGDLSRHQKGIQTGIVVVTHTNTWVTLEGEFTISD